MANEWYIVQTYTGYEGKVSRVIQQKLDNGDLSSDIVKSIKVPEEEVVEIKDAPDEGTVTGFHIKGSAEDTANTDVAIDNVPVKYGDTYVMSCYAKGTGRIGIQHGKGPYIKEEFDVCDEWKRYETEFVIGDSDGSTVMSPATNVYFGVPAGVESDVVICGMIMVKK